MPIIDIVIVIAVLISVVIGLVRGFIKEAISLAALLFAIWAAMYFGPAVGKVSAGWLSAQDLQQWFGRILVFAVILSIGGLVGWGLAKLVRLSILSGMDRLFGSLFGFCRGVLLIAVAIIGAEFSDIDEAGLVQELDSGTASRSCGRVDQGHGPRRATTSLRPTRRPTRCRFPTNYSTPTGIESHGVIHVRRYRNR